MAGGSPMSIVNHLFSGCSKAISTVGLPKPLSANHDVVLVEILGITPVQDRAVLIDK